MPSTFFNLLFFFLILQLNSYLFLKTKKKKMEKGKLSCLSYQILVQVWTWIQEGRSLEINLNISTFFVNEAI